MLYSEAIPLCDNRRFTSVTLSCIHMTKIHKYISLLLAFKRWYEYFLTLLYIRRQLDRNFKMGFLFKLVFCLGAESGYN